MKNKLFVCLLGTLALALGLVLAGCESSLDPDNSDNGPYTVTFEPGEGGGTPPENMSVYNGETFTLPGQGDMTAPEGKTFRGWESSVSLPYGVGGKYNFSAGESATINKDVTFTAEWGTPLTITFSLGEVEGTPPDTIYIAPRTAFTLPEAPAVPEDKVFRGWEANESFFYKTDISQSSVTSYTPGGSTPFGAGASIIISYDYDLTEITFTAIWGDKIEVAFSLGGAEGTPPETMFVTYRTAITLPEAPAAPEDKTFQCWKSSNGILSGNTTEREFSAGDSVIITPWESDLTEITFTAQWRNKLTVTFSLGSVSGIPPQSMSVGYGTAVTLPFIEEPEGKIFQKWRRSNNNTEYSAGDSVTIYDDLTFTALWIDKKYSQEGIYISLISFAGSANILGNDFVFLSSTGKTTLSSTLNSSYSKASAAGTALFYGVHRGLANLTANLVEFPKEISSINLITFTDGLDNGSFGASNNNPIEGKSGVTSVDYAAYVHDEIGSRKINGTPVTAYSVGVKGSDVEDEEQFVKNLTNIASGSDKVKQLTEMSELEAAFSEIAEGLSFSSHFSMTTTQNDPGTIVRMTFDVAGTSSADAAASTRYIEGTLAYPGGLWTLTDIVYGSGITSDTVAGGSITGTVSGSNVSFLFKNIKGNELTGGATVQQWTKASAASVWQRNSEYSSSGSTSTSTVLIQLTLDASTSLSDSNITQIRSAVNRFISGLYDRISGGGN
jgi:hypothetical protein